MKTSRVIGDAARKGLTPLLDMLFLLLFTVLSVSETKREEAFDLVRITLPDVEPSSSVNATQPRVLVLEIDGDSRVHLPAAHAIARTREELERLLRIELNGASPGEAAVEIHGDRDARHGVAVQLLQHLRLAGFTQVSLVAKGDGAAQDFGGER